MTGGIYKIVNLVNGKVYIGSAKDFKKRWRRHISDLNKGKHSSIKLQRSYNKHGKNNFKFEIVEYAEYTIDIKNLEQKYIDLYNSKVVGYNIADASFGDILSTHPNRLDIIKRIKKSTHERLLNMTVQEKQIKFGRSGSKNGNYNPDRHKNFSCIKCGCDISYKSSLGRNLCSVCIKTGKENPFYGKTHSDETRNTIKRKAMGNKNRPLIKVKVDDEIFNSCSECAKKFNISNGSVTHRIKSDNFPNWSYVNA